MFENHSRMIIGLERLMLEASGFDFRNRHPQRLIVKMAKSQGLRKAKVGKTAYRISLDLYRTFAPLKQTTPTMAFACLELAAHLCGENPARIVPRKTYNNWKISRPEVMGEDRPPFSMTD